MNDENLTYNLNFLKIKNKTNARLTIMKFK